MKKQKRIIIGIILIALITITVILAQNDKDDKLILESFQIKEILDNQKNFLPKQKKETNNVELQLSNIKETIILNQEKEYKPNNILVELNKEEKRYRHEDDPMFDCEIFSGFVNEDNIDYRDELFSRKDCELIQDQMEENPSENSINNVVFQFENVIDYALGIDFPEEKRIQIRNTQREMLLKRSIVDDLMEQGAIAEELYFTQLEKFFEESIENIAKITTDEEFEALYQIKKENIYGSFKKLTNLSIEDEEIYLE